MNIGEKIKDIRVKKGITQSELAKDKITRNMLSQIENGRATPSIPTLIHIAKMLEVPVEYLISEGESIFDFTKKPLLQRLKNAYASKKYSECIRIWEKSEKQTDDEISLILAHSYLEYGSILLSNGNLESAVAMLEKSSDFADRTIYNTHDVKAKISLFGAIAKNVQSPKLEFSEDEYVSESNKSVCSDLYNYLIENRKHKYTNTIMERHLKAKELIRAFHYTEATDILTEIEANRARSPVDSYILFSIYNDLEYCAKELSNFEDAYKYSSKRIALLSAFKS